MTYRCHADVHRWTPPRGQETGHVPEGLVIAVGDRASAHKESVELGELTRAEGALDIRDPVVESEALHLVIPLPLVAPETGGIADDAVGPEGPGSLCERGVIRQDGPTLARRDVLDGVERER